MNTSTLLSTLADLVACDTQNPPRRIDGESDIFCLCRTVVGDGFEVRISDHGDGHVTWYAVKGSPKLLFNVHLDTVPIGQGWTSDPLRLSERDGRVYGRGACDIKGAAAVLLTLAQQGAENLALLFTSDEEGAEGCCVERFLQSAEAEQYSQVVVAEPTGCKAVLEHRGYLSVKTRFRGVPGHSSEARALADNANHQMAEWAAGALGVARALKTSESDPGSCLNIGIIEGGSKSNVIAGEAFVHWSARLQPGASNEAFLQSIKSCALPSSQVVWEVPFAGEPLPASGRNSHAAEKFCRDSSLELGRAVDFWTEAALFSAAGMGATVLGPGHIAQAHVADEWVDIAQLERAFNLYSQLVQADG